jgi:hypothetical protein
MENTLHLPILILVFLLILRYLEDWTSLRVALSLGLGFGLLMWVRSDAVVFVCLALVLIAMYLRTRITSGLNALIRSLACAVGVTALIGMAYLLFNFLAVGSLQTTSSQVKLFNSLTNSWSIVEIMDSFRLHVAMLFNLFDDLGGLTWIGLNWRILPFQLAFIVWSLIATVWWIRRRRRWKPITLAGMSPEGFVFTLLSLFALLHVVYLITLLRRMLLWTPWYMVPQVLAVLVIVPLFLFPKSLIGVDLPRVARRLTGRFAAKRYALVVTPEALCVLVRPGLLVLGVMLLMSASYAMAVPIKELYERMETSTDIEPYYELAVWLNDNVDKSDTVGMFDAGAVGYFAKAHVVNLDGLVNSPDYVDVVRRQDFTRYVIEKQLDYVILYYFPPHEMRWQEGPDSSVCYRIQHINRNPAAWGRDGGTNFLEVAELRYSGECDNGWSAGFPYRAVAPPPSTMQKGS